MKVLWLLGMSLGLVGCSLLPEKVAENPWEYTGLRPKRVVLLVLESSSRDLEVFKQKGLHFEKAWVGHLLDRPGISFSVIAQGLLPKHLNQAASFWQDTLPGDGSQKLIMTSSSYRGFISESAIDFFKSQPHWTSLIAQIPASQGLSEARKILSYLESSNLLRETLLILTAEKGKEVPHQVYSKNSKLPAALRSLTPLPWQSLEADSSLRFFLSKKDKVQITKLTSALKKLPEVSEVFYRTEISQRSYYIRTYRSFSQTPEEFEWSKKHTPILLQATAHSTGPEVIAFLNSSSWSQEQIQTIPLWIWAPHLRMNNSVIKTQMENTPARLVDIAPMIFELLGLKTPYNLDGTSLGISSLLD